MRPRPTSVALAATLAAGLALTACGSADDSAADSSTGSDDAASSLFDQAAADLLPDEIAAEGVIHVASGPGYPPMLDVAEDGSTLSGSQPEELRLIGEVLGVDIVFDDIKFDVVFPALESGKTDAAAMALGITAERLQTVDFVSDYQGGTTLLVAGGNPEDLSIDTLCGHSVGVQKGSTENDVTLPIWDAECTDAGEPAIDISTFTTAADAILALSSKRVEATVSAVPPAVYQAQQSQGALEALDINFEPSPWGIALPKGSELAAPIQAALAVLIENGAYLDNLTEFGVEVGAVESAEIYTSPDQLPAQ